MSGLLEGSEMIGDDDVREVSEFVNRKIQTKGGVVYLYLAHQSPIASGEWRVAGDGWASQQRYKSCFIQGPTSMHVQHPNPADGGRGIAPLRKQVSKGLKLVLARVAVVIMVMVIVDWLIAMK
jgi:hypothetical protein